MGHIVWAVVSGVVGGVGKSASSLCVLWGSLRFVVGVVLRYPKYT
jgi:hypothetical protein